MLANVCDVTYYCTYLPIVAAAATATHGWALQLRLCCVCAHGLPPPLAGLLIDLCRVCVPVPHVRVHAVAAHVAHLFIRHFTRLGFGFGCAWHPLSILLLYVLACTRCLPSNNNQFQLR